MDFITIKLIKKVKNLHAGDGLEVDGSRKPIYNVEHLPVGQTIISFLSGEKIFMWNDSEVVTYERISIQ